MILNVWIEMFAAPRTICFSLPMHCENLAWWQQKNADDLCHKLLLVKNPTQIFFFISNKTLPITVAKDCKNRLKTNWGWVERIFWENSSDILRSFLITAQTARRHTNIHPIRSNSINYTYSLESYRLEIIFSMHLTLNNIFVNEIQCECVRVDVLHFFINIMLLTIFIFLLRSARACALLLDLLYAFKTPSLFCDFCQNRYCSEWETMNHPLTQISI